MQRHVKVLIAGWFSFEHMGTTGGDIIACDIVARWLKEAGIKYDIAFATPFKTAESIQWETSNPADYSEIIFVCGPFGNGWPVTDFLSHFPNSKLIGLNLSLLQSLDEWNPFALLYERDSNKKSNPDLTFSGTYKFVPVVGVILIDHQIEYGIRDKHKEAHEAIQNLLSSREMSLVYIDTALEDNKTGFRTPGEIESIISRMDLVVTTRLHGTVLSLKNGVPVMPFDPIAGGAKISAQVKTIGWPVLFNTDTLNEKALNAAYDFCLTEEARIKARQCAANAKARVDAIGQDLVREIRDFQK